MGTTVLIVDDSKLARIVVAKAIAALQPGWTKVEASNADEALAVLRDGQVDLAILDFNMPGRNGLELAEHMRHRYPDMPIALATANVQDEVIARARAANATFVSKPITEDGIRDFLSGAALKLRAVHG
ncbi:response regulator [Nitrospirillum viridazoti]|uniref:Response regulator n=1 Tax=Nitrospirillum viridazoti CBAmc TaxID=1441467 RepID=A0A248JZJ4_9PROT|nr:response regulator [Nitrospirillum amazonense]ASG23578.1 response regulator [Nitrospirillum amazonense CBAmc]TWB33790.1 response regulator receiver domain-containing protein [Nitrospirillum amazonense]